MTTRHKFLKLMSEMHNELAQDEYFCNRWDFEYNIIQAFEVYEMDKADALSVFHQLTLEYQKWRQES